MDVGRGVAPVALGAVCPQCGSAAAQQDQERRTSSTPITSPVMRPAVHLEGRATVGPGDTAAWSPGPSSAGQAALQLGHLRSAFLVEFGSESPVPPLSSLGLRTGTLAEQGRGHPNFPAGRLPETTDSAPVASPVHRADLVSPASPTALIAQTCSAADTVRNATARRSVHEKRRYQHRLPGHRRRTLRPGLRPRLRHASRASMGDSELRDPHRAAVIVFAPDPVRQAGHGHVGPCERRSDARDANGRRARRHGRRRLAARRVLRLVGRCGDGPPSRRPTPRDGRTRDP